MTYKPDMNTWRAMGYDWEVIIKHSDLPSEKFTGKEAPARRIYARQVEETTTAIEVTLVNNGQVIERHVFQQNEEEEQYTFACTMCEWSKTLHVDDISAYYEKPFPPCGCTWECIQCVG